MASIPPELLEQQNIQPAAPPGAEEIAGPYEQPHHDEAPNGDQASGFGVQSQTSGAAAAAARRRRSAQLLTRKEADMAIERFDRGGYPELEVG